MNCLELFNNLPKDIKMYIVKLFDFEIDKGSIIMRAARGYNKLIDIELGTRSSTINNICLLCFPDEFEEKFRASECSEKIK